MRNLCRVDHEASSTHCWRVTIQRRTELFTRDFSDGVHSGREQALQAALAYRNTVIETHPPFGKPEYCKILKKSNRSSVSGLTRVDLCWRSVFPTADRHTRRRSHHSQDRMLLDFRSRP